MIRLKEMATGKLVWVVGKDEHLSSFDPHLHAIIRGDYGRHNIGMVAEYIDAKGWELETAAFRLTEEDRKYIEAHKNDPPISETKYSD
jgi:hypothetical protein